jgi:hypothetical protein
MNEQELVRSVMRGDTTVPSEEDIDEASAESFPASDSPPWWAGPPSRPGRSPADVTLPGVRGVDKGG